ncbi:hypothetical protein E2C01_090395 [Portunus trituberculatus]|uniref:Uncharacterized protein n=1 Tax=Portunus trituberculatus TaxID=210409 RepID=A0A5B7JLP8_PORTR|nr:hypothetical protein [Portunus trituberculatus]
MAASSTAFPTSRFNAEQGVLLPRRITTLAGDTKPQDMRHTASTTVAGVFTEQATPDGRGEDLWVAGSGRGSVSCNN